jgi:hypothetical protein
MKANLAIILTLLLFNNSIAQNPLVKQWDKRFGGTSQEYFSTVKQTSDGGFILGGYTYSGIGGDKTEPSRGDRDYWVVKTDSIGNKQWDKRFGGDTLEIFTALYPALDGGYILGGYSQSGISGDKTQPNWNTSGSSYDYWVVKIDSLGTKQWDKRFGGTALDYLYSLYPTSDGGYILGGYSGSGISGDKTQPVWGGLNDADYWIVKIDSAGNKQWDKDFGGTDGDELYSIQQTSDKGYILGGYTYSGIGGDKTQPNWGSFTFDYWIVKTDSLGNKQWDKDFGGTSNDQLYSLQQTSDGGYILSGTSFSGISGDKTQPNWDPSNSTADYWMVKTDAAGNKMWDKRFGGIGEERKFGNNISETNVVQTYDGGYLITGTTDSPLSGDKTENNLGAEQTWVVKTDFAGNKQWDKTIFTGGHDAFSYGIQTTDGCYVFANRTTSGIAGYKTQPAWNALPDYWMVKLCDTTALLGIFSQNSFQEISVYPNPFITGISLRIKKQNIKQLSFIIKNILGQKVFENTKVQISNSNYQTNLDLGFLSNGVYLLEATIDGERMVKKIVKE